MYSVIRTLPGPKHGQIRGGSVCACACVHACVHACVCVRVCACRLPLILAASIFSILHSQGRLQPQHEMMQLAIGWHVQASMHIQGS